MCGIFGAIGAVAVDAEAALASQDHRGPDSRGIWRGDGAVFGHNRLAIIDLSPGGAQPMASAGGDVVVVFNGEIYNHHALRAELVAAGSSFRSRSDTEVIVEGYRTWGDGVVERLDGMFAIAIWDVRRRRLLCARDRAGKKPFFYTHDRDGFRFASEPKAILASGIVPELALDALPGLFAYGYTAAPRSMYRGILQLAPASTLLLEAGREPVIRRYWKAPFAQPSIEDSPEVAARTVRRLLEAAVEKRLESDVPLGAFLSGGVDSTIVVGIMARLLGRKVKTFSIGFSGDPRYDETHYARLAARAFDTDHTEFTLQPTSFDLVERLVELHDGPFGDSSAIPTSVVAGLTRQHVTVALTGDGGDELFCGYVRFLAAEAAERIPAPLRMLGGVVGERLPGGSSERSLLGKARRFLRIAALPLPDRLARLISLFTFELDQLFRPELRAKVDTTEPLEWMRGIVAASAGASTLSRTLDHNFETYLPYDLLVKADRSSMAHSLEARSPFLDTALIEYAARLPNRYRHRRTETKWMLKHAFADLIPREIMTRGKMGFGVPLGTWFRGDLRGYLEDHFRASARMYEYLEPTYVRALLDEHMSGRADHGHRLWLLLTFEIWLRQSAGRQRARA